MSNKKLWVLIFLYLVFFFFAARNIVVPDSKLFEREYDLVAGQEQIVTTVPLKTSCFVKCNIFGDNIINSIETFKIFFNNQELIPNKKEVRDNYLRYELRVDQAGVVKGKNSITFSIIPDKAQCSILNFKKSYLRYEKIYIGDFYLLTSAGKASVGFSIMSSIIFACSMTFVWFLMSLFLSALFDYTYLHVYRFNLILLTILFAIIVFFKTICYVSGISVALGSTISSVSLLILFVAYKCAEVLMYGRKKLLFYYKRVLQWFAKVEDRYRLSIVLVVLFIISYIAVFFTLQYLRYTSFVSSMDLNCIVQLVFNAMEGRVNEVQNGAFELVNYLKFHLQPAYILFVPMYYVFRSNLLFYFVQTAVIALGALPVYWIAREKLKHKGYAVCFSILYLLYPSIHNCTMYGFHLEELSIGIGLFAFYFLISKKRGLFFVSCLLLMSLKENVAAIPFMLGIYAFFCGEKKLGILVSLISVAWVYITLFDVIPLYTPEGQITYSETFFRNLGGSKDDVIINLFSNMYTYLRPIITDPFKSNFLYHLFAPLIFLPILAPEILMIALPIFGQLLLSNYLRFHDITVFYQSSLLPFVVIAAIYGFNRLVKGEKLIAKRIFGYKGNYFSIVVIGIMFISTLYYSHKNITPKHAPGYFRPEVYSVSDRDRDIKQHLDEIPAGASLASPMKYYEYLSGRRYQYYIFPETIQNKKPELVLIDSYMCWPAYGEYRYNGMVIHALDASDNYRLTLKYRGYYLFEKKDTMHPCSIYIYDHTFFHKTYDSENNAYEYGKDIYIPEDGFYTLYVGVSDAVISCSNADKGYDSFEFLPGFRGVVKIAQSFSPQKIKYNVLQILVRRIGNPVFSLSIREDVHGKPGGAYLTRIEGTQSQGKAYKYSWIDFDISDVLFDMSKKYWFVLSVEGEKNYHRYEIAAFNRSLKKGYKDSIYYIYDGKRDVWAAPYKRNQKIDNEFGNDIDGIIFRMVRKEEFCQNVVVRVDGVKHTFAEKDDKRYHNIYTLKYEKIPLVKGKNNFIISGDKNFQLKYLKLEKIQ